MNSCFRDRFRTMINVLGDSIGAGIVNHYSVGELDSHPDEQEMEETSYQDPPEYPEKEGNVNNGFSQIPAGASDSTPM